MNRHFYLFWGYTTAWIVFAGYLAWLGWRLIRLSARLEELERRLRDRGGAGG